MVINPKKSFLFLNLLVASERFSYYGLQYFLVLYLIQIKGIPDF